MNLLAVEKCYLLEHVTPGCLSSRPYIFQSIPEAAMALHLTLFIKTQRRAPVRYAKLHCAAVHTLTEGDQSASVMRTTSFGNATASPRKQPIPIRVCRSCDQNLSSLESVNLINIGNDPNFARDLMDTSQLSMATSNFRIWASSYLYINNPI